MPRIGEDGFQIVVKLSPCQISGIRGEGFPCWLKALKPVFGSIFGLVAISHLYTGYVVVPLNKFCPRSGRKRSSNWRNLKTPSLRRSSREDRKHFELDTKLFKKRRYNNHVISLPQFSSNTNSKWPVMVAFLNSSGAVWTENV